MDPTPPVHLNTDADARCATSCDSEPRGPLSACGRTACEACPVAAAACCRALSRVTRTVLLAGGLLAVGLGALGVVVPGLPTTVFLIIAAWCFCRSCPPLERWLLSTRLFRPYAVFLDGRTPVPPKAERLAIASIWIASLISSALLLVADPGGRGVIIVAMVLMTAAAGHVCVAWLARRSRRVAQA